MSVHASGVLTTMSGTILKYSSTLFTEAECVKPKGELPANPFQSKIYGWIALPTSFWGSELWSLYLQLSFLTTEPSPQLPVTLYIFF